MKELVNEAEKILTDKDRDLNEFGRLMDYNWQMKRSLNKDISTSFIDEIYERAKKAGALGGKVLGAGGGGFILFYVELDKQASVRRALQDLLYVPFQFETEGTSVIYYQPETYLPQGKRANLEDDVWFDDQQGYWMNREMKEKLAKKKRRRRGKGMIAVIMAGGKGTRIASVSTEVPKPMIPLCGKPVLEWQLECLKAQNITEILLVTGHLHQVISDYFGDGSRMGMQISYLVEESPLGTAGAFYYLKDRLDGDFLLLNGDVMFDVDFARFVQAHQHYGGVATIFTHPNQHPYDSAIVVCKENGQVVNWLHKEEKKGMVCKSCQRGTAFVFTGNL